MKLLLVVDYQNDFVNGSLGFDKAQEIDEKIAEKIREFHNNNEMVAFTLDTHYENYLETFEGKNLPVKHCIKGTTGWELYGKTKLEKKDTDIVFEKNTFPSLELAKWLENKDFDIVEIVGLVSNICVVSNAVMVKSALPEAEIIVCAELIASANTDLHDKTLDVLEGLQVKIPGR